MIEVQDILDWIDEAPAPKVKQYAMLATASMNKVQLEALGKRFKKKIDFEPTPVKLPKPKKPAKIEEEEQPVDDDLQLDDEPPKPPSDESFLDGIDSIEDPVDEVKPGDLVP